MNSPKILACCLALGACGPNRTNDAGNVVDVSPDVLRMDSQQDDAQQNDAQEPDIVAPRDVVAVRDVPDVQRRDTVARDIFVCPDAGMVCSDRCVDTTTDRLNCGTCDNVCPVPAGGYAGCLNSVCNQDCNAEDHLCGESCVPDTSPASCGALCTPCPTTPNGYATCDGRWCGLACDAGFKLVGSTCVIEPPRLIAPLSVASTTTPRPMLHWELSAVLTGSRVEVCADRSCSTVEQTHDFPARETSVRLQTLSVGSHFWRVSAHSLSGQVVTAGPSWEFYVGRHDTPVDSSWSTRPDYNGDGIDDLVVLEPHSSAAGRANVYMGRAGGVRTTPDQAVLQDAERHALGTAARSAPDLNGDGFPDIVIAANPVLVYFGGSAGFPAIPSRRISPPATAPVAGFGDNVEAVGDINGDGFGDLVAAAGSSVFVYLGSKDGPAATPSFVLARGAASQISRGGDMNGDGYADFIVPFTNAATGFWSACVYFGSASFASSSECPEENTVTSFGYKSDFLGDVDGDGYSDVGHITVPPSFAVAILGGTAPNVARRVGWSIAWRNGAQSIGSAGDVNHDGKDDLIVGLQSPGVPEALVFLGRSTTGIVTTPADFTLAGDPSDTTILFGTSVTSRDLNADGFDDMLVSSPSFNQGTVFIYNGGPSGPSPTPSLLLGSTGGSDFGRVMAVLFPRNARPGIFPQAGVRVPAVSLAALARP